MFLNTIKRILLKVMSFIMTKIQIADPILPRWNENNGLI